MYKRDREIGDDARPSPVVERRLSRLFKQCAQMVALGFDRLRPVADPVAEIAPPSGCRVRPGIAPWSPNDQDRTSLNVARKENRLVIGLNPIALASKRLLNFLEIAIQSSRRKNRPATFLGNSQNDVPSVLVLKVVRESANGASNGSSGEVVECRFELNSNTLNGSRVK
jgi:hypothetical protein